METPDREPTTREILERLDAHILEQSKFNAKLDERFYQLSKDTLVFARNVIVTAAVVAVVAPLLRDSLAIALNLLNKQ
jgi:hypothetical protein